MDGDFVSLPLGYIVEGLERHGLDDPKGHVSVQVRLDILSSVEWDRDECVYGCGLYIWVCNYGHWLTLHLREWLSCKPVERGGRSDLLTTLVGMGVVLGLSPSWDKSGIHLAVDCMEYADPPSPPQGEGRGDLEYVCTHQPPRPAVGEVIDVSTAEAPNGRKVVLDDTQGPAGFF